MTAFLVVGGLVLLAIIVLHAGLSLLDRGSRRQAWRRIAAERRWINEQQQWLRDPAQRTSCAHCPFRDDRFQLADNWDCD